MLIQKFYNRQDVLNKRDYNAASEMCQHLAVIAWEYLKLSYLQKVYDFQSIFVPIIIILWF